MPYAISEKCVLDWVQVSIASSSSSICSAQWEEEESIQCNFCFILYITDQWIELKKQINSFKTGFRIDLHSGSSFVFCYDAVHGADVLIGTSVFLYSAMTSIWNIGNKANYPCSGICLNFQLSEWIA